MTQKIFDTDNAEDMALLWSILPSNVSYGKRNCDCIPEVARFYDYQGINVCNSCELLKINWHDKTEITRPIQEATKADIGKLCKFWDKSGCYYGVLTNVGDYNYKYQMNNNSKWWHCRRLTKQEIKELC